MKTFRLAHPAMNEYRFNPHSECLQMSFYSFVYVFVGTNLIWIISS